MVAARSKYYFKLGDHSRRSPAAIRGKGVGILCRTHTARGFQDSIGPNAAALRLVENSFARLRERHWLPRNPHPDCWSGVELYARSSGETSDIVEKQMYVFTDRDEAETTIALRPEGTPGVVRAYIEAGLDRSDPEQRLYYSGRDVPSRAAAEGALSAVLSIRRRGVWARRRGLRRGSDFDDR